MITRAEAERRVLKEFASRPPDNILKHFVDGYLEIHNRDTHSNNKHALRTPTERTDFIRNQPSQKIKEQRRLF